MRAGIDDILDADSFLGDGKFIVFEYAEKSYEIECIRAGITLHEYDQSPLKGTGRKRPSDN